MYRKPAQAYPEGAGVGGRSVAQVRFGTGVPLATMAAMSAARMTPTVAPWATTGNAAPARPARAKAGWSGPRGAWPPGAGGANGRATSCALTEPCMLGGTPASCWAVTTPFHVSPPHDSNRNAESG